MNEKVKKVFEKIISDEKIHKEFLKLSGNEIFEFSLKHSDSNFTKEEFDEALAEIFILAVSKNLNTSKLQNISEGDLEMVAGGKKLRTQLSAALMSVFTLLPSIGVGATDTSMEQNTQNSSIIKKESWIKKYLKNITGGTTKKYPIKVAGGIVFVGATAYAVWYKWTKAKSIEEILETFKEDTKNLPLKEAMLLIKNFLSSHYVFNSDDDKKKIIKDASYIDSKFEELEKKINSTEKDKPSDDDLRVDLNKIFESLLRELWRSQVNKAKEAAPGFKTELEKAESERQMQEILKNVVTLSKGLKDGTATDKKEKVLDYLAEAVQIVNDNPEFFNTKYVSTDEYNGKNLVELVLMSDEFNIDFKVDQASFNMFHEYIESLFLKSSLSPEVILSMYFTKHSSHRKIINNFIQKAEDGNTINQGIGEEGKTILLIAIESGWYSYVPALLDAGADVNVVIQRIKADGMLERKLRNNEESTLLLLAISRRGWQAFIQPLINEGADVNAQDKYRYNALDYAVFYQNKDTIEILLEDNNKDQIHRALKRSIMDFKKDIVEFLLAEYKGHINLKEKVVMYAGEALTFMELLDNCIDNKYKDPRITKDPTLLGTLREIKLILEEAAQ